MTVLILAHRWAPTWNGAGARNAFGKSVALSAGDGSRAAAILSAPGNDGNGGNGGSGGNGGNVGKACMVVVVMCGFLTRQEVNGAVGR